MSKTNNLKHLNNPILVLKRVVLVSPPPPSVLPPPRLPYISSTTATATFLHFLIWKSPSSPLPSGWQKFLDLQTGEIYYSKTGKKGLIALEGEMSRRNGPKLDLKLNLSPPRVSSDPLLESPSRSLTVSPTSPPSSCVSSERNLDESPRYASSPEATSMMLVGCPRCLMYVMLAEEDPRCPKCKSTVLLDVIPDSNTINNTGRKTKKS